MSATNRGGQRSEADFYATPAWCVRRLLEAVDLPQGRWLEPSAGDGAIILAANERRGDIRWTAVELRDEAGVPFFERAPADLKSRLDGWFCFDYLGVGPPQRQFDVAIGNPPFRMAMEFVTKAMSHARIVAFLLRLGFLETPPRTHFLQNNPPSVYVLPDRPSFKGKGSDATAYGWFVWGLYRTPRIHVLNTTPKSEMEEDRGQLPLMPSTAQESMLR